MLSAFIPAAAPAPQPAPSADIQAGGVETFDTAAFDAALADTLGIIEAEAARTSATIGTAAAPAKWLLLQLRRAAGECAPMADERNVVEPSVPASTGVPVEEGASGEDVPRDREVSVTPEAMQADLVVPVPVAATPEVVAPAPLPVPASAFSQPAPTADVSAPVVVTATESASAPVDLPASVVPSTTSESTAAAPAIVPAATQPGRDVRPLPPSNRTSAEIPIAENAPVAAAPQEALVAEGPAVTEPEVLPQEIERGGIVRPVPRAAKRETDAVRRQEVSIPSLPSTPATAAPDGSAAVVQAVVIPQMPVGSAGVAPKQADPAEVVPTPRLTISTDAPSGHGAATTSDDQLSQGQQGRPSPEFMRLMASLSQFAPAAAEDAGRSVASLPTQAPLAAPASVSAVPAASPVPATAATAATVMPAATETPDAENIGRLVQAIRIHARPGAWEATVRLKPEHLGEVTISLRVERNSVSALVNAEAAGVRQWLESQEQAVRNGMAEQGLQLERFVVQRDGQRRDAQPQEQEPRRRQPRRPPEATERFEVVV